MFTDPASIREFYRGTSDPEEIYLIEHAFEGGGTAFPIKDNWKTQFEAQARLDATNSSFVWNG